MTRVADVLPRIERPALGARRRPIELTRIPKNRRASAGVAKDKGQKSTATGATRWEVVDVRGHRTASRNRVAAGNGGEGVLSPARNPAPILRRRCALGLSRRLWTFPRRSHVSLVSRV